MGSNAKYNVVDLFAGMGGLSLPFHNDADFNVVLANELLRPMAETYMHNHPLTVMRNCDIRELDPKEELSRLDPQDRRVDVVLGGPPCQSFSTLGKRDPLDERGTLFREYVRMLEGFRPRLFVFENVKGLLTMRGGETLREIRGEFRRLGYDLHVEVLNAADYGTPQTRERLIIVGTLGSGVFRFPEPMHFNPTEGTMFIDGRRPWVTFGEATGDLPPLRCGESSCTYASEPQNEYQRIMREGCSDTLTEHCATHCKDSLVRLMEALPEGGTPDNVPECIRPKSGFRNSYSRLWWDRPSTTVTRNFATPASTRCVHPRDPRPLTVREAMRLQGFHDCYRLVGSECDKRLMIGNAVPVPLASAIKGSVRRSLKES